MQTTEASTIQLNAQQVRRVMNIAREKQRKNIHTFLEEARTDVEEKIMKAAVLGEDKCSVRLNRVDPQWSTQLIDQIGKETFGEMFYGMSSVRGTYEIELKFSWK